MEPQSHIVCLHLAHGFYVRIVCAKQLVAKDIQAGRQGAFEPPFLASKDFIVYMLPSNTALPFVNVPLASLP